MFTDSGTSHGATETFMKSSTDASGEARKERDPSGISHQVRLLGVVALKDLRIEFRSRQAFQTTLFFALLVLIVFQFAFDPGDAASRAASPGILWVALLFPGMIRLNQSFAIETEEGGIQGIVLSPLDRGVFFLGKFLGNWLFLLAVNLVIVALFLLFFGFRLTGEALLLLIPIVMLGLAGFSAIGTIFAAMLSRSRNREVLLPVLIFPIVIPVLLAAVNGTQEVLLHAATGGYASWMKILTAFVVVYLATGFLVFDHVIGE